MKLVLFDFDGTLVDSAGLIYETMRRTFEAFSHPAPTFEATKSIIGLTLDIAIARLQGKPHVDDEAVQMAALNGIGDIYNGPSQTWVIRQADRTVWVHLYVGSAQGSMAVVEAKALAPTSL